MQSAKPRVVLYAQIALWIWTAWTCLFGMYQAWRSLPEIENTIAEQSQGMIAVPTRLLQEFIVGGYAGLAPVLLLVVFGIGAGNKVARASIAWLSLLWAFFSPFHEGADYLTDIPDIGLQSIALYFLYTQPGAAWFQHAKKARA